LSIKTTDIKTIQENNDGKINLGWDPIHQLNSAILLCLSQDLDSNVICCGPSYVCLLKSGERWLLF